MDSVEPKIQTEEPKIESEEIQNPTETIIPLSNNKGILPNTEPSSARIGSEFQAQIPESQSHLDTCQLHISPAVPISWTPHNTPLPHSQPSKFSQAEKDAFLLGFYIFKKKLNFLTRFVSKKVGDVLAYYYTEFYKSEGYCRVKGKKCVSGEDVFCGWRQLEVLSRLEELVPQEQHGALREAFNSFNDKSSTFDHLILTLQSLTSTQSLLRALSIGKGKSDLTRIRPDPTRAKKSQTRLEIPVGKQWGCLSAERILGFLNGDVRLSKASAWIEQLKSVVQGLNCNPTKVQGLTNRAFIPFIYTFLPYDLQPGLDLTRLKIPVGKQWGCLSAERILGFLNGDVRLSKARSNDLFWEAIWPRLLVRGWTSYQPKDHPLVFLKPGIQIPDFSTQNLVKGFHYFDSVSDLLSNVASDPDSLKNTEIAPEINNGNNNNGGGFSGNFVGQEMEIMMSFTIIDTSLVKDKVSSLRNLPIRDICSINSAGQSQSDTSASLSEGSGLDSLMKNEPAKNKSKKNKTEDKELKKPKEEGYLPPVCKKRKLVACKKEKENYKNAPNKKQVSEPSIDLNLDLPDLKTECEIDNQQSFTKDLDVKLESEIINDQKSCEKDLDVNTEKEGSSVENNRRHGTRNRPPTAKALEALAFGFIGTNKKKKNREILSYNSERPKRRARKSGEKNFEWRFGQEKNGEKNDLSVGLFACTEIQSDDSLMKVE